MAGQFHLDVDRLLKRCLGNTGLATQMLDLFAEHVPPVAVKLRAAAQEDNWAEAARTAHRLKGSVGNICSDTLSALACDAEKAAEAQDGTALRKATDAIADAIAECLPQIEQIRKDLASA